MLNKRPVSPAWLASASLWFALAAVDAFAPGKLPDRCAAAPLLVAHLCPCLCRWLCLCLCLCLCCTADAGAVRGEAACVGGPGPPAAHKDQATAAGTQDCSRQAFKMTTVTTAWLSSAERSGYNPQLQHSWPCNMVGVGVVRDDSKWLRNEACCAGCFVLCPLAFSCPCDASDLHTIPVMALMDHSG